MNHFSNELSTCVCVYPSKRVVCPTRSRDAAPLPLRQKPLHAVVPAVATRDALELEQHALGGRHGEVHGLFRPARRAHRVSRTWQRGVVAHVVHKRRLLGYRMVDDLAVHAVLALRHLLFVVADAACELKLLLRGVDLRVQDVVCIRAEPPAWARCVQKGTAIMQPAGNARVSASQGARGGCSVVTAHAHARFPRPSSARNARRIHAQAPRRRMLRICLVLRPLGTQSARSLRAATLLASPNMLRRCRPLLRGRARARRAAQRTF